MMAIAGLSAIRRIANLKDIRINNMERKAHTFGALRMYAATMKAPGEFKAFLLRERYTEAEIINIKKAFESLSTPKPVTSETVF